MTTQPTAGHDHTPALTGDTAPGAPRDLDEHLFDDALLDAAVAGAQRDAARYHRLLGCPIAVWRDGRVVEELPPADDVPATRER